MMLAVAALLIGFSQTQAPQDNQPILWLNRAGEILLEGQPVDPKSDGVTQVHTPDGAAYDFSAEKGGLLFGDPKSLRVSGSMTISAWVFPRQFARNGAQAELFFRGDDRNGFDPYCLLITKDGKLVFSIEDEKDTQAKVEADLGIQRWFHVLASLNASTGEMALYVNGYKAASEKTSVRPFVNLLPQYTPGVGVGNVQNNHGPHNQPFDGLIADLRVYKGVVSPHEAGFVGDRNAPVP